MGARKDRPPYEPNDLVAGKYAIRKILGEGGMAVVYGAVDTTCDRHVAIKILRPSVAARRGLSSAHVQREAATVVKLHERTPHVVEVLTAGVTEDAHRLPYYVMERLYGTSLRTGIEEKRALQRPFEIIEVASTVTEIAMALAHAHQMGIVHRDVKPENVFLAEQRDGAYIVKLLDFGISTLVTGEPTASHRRTFTGSRPYASPEQLDGRAATPAGDVYALGLILYEMLTFTLPHDRLNPALSVAQTALNVWQMPLPPLRERRADVPPRLEILVKACLAHDPQARPTALQVATMLREVLRSFEQKLLGTDESNASTDVEGPPVAVLLQRLNSATGDYGADAPQRFAGTQPVDLLASTDPPRDPGTAVMAADHEVFFMNPVTERTDPIPQVFEAHAPPIEPQRVVMLAAPAAPVEVEPPPQQPRKHDITAPWPIQPFTPPPPAAIPAAVFVAAWPTPPVATTHQSIEGVASMTQPEPAPEATWRRPRQLALAVFLAACLVAIVAGFLAPGALARRTAAHAAPSATDLAVALSAQVVSPPPAPSAAPSAVPTVSPVVALASAPSPLSAPLVTASAQRPSPRTPSPTPSAQVPIDPEFRQRLTE